MSETADPRNDVRRYNNERERINRAMQEGDIADSDGEVLLEWGAHLRNVNEVSTAHGNMSSCRKAAEKAAAVGMPAVSTWDEATLDTFMVRMEDADFPEEHQNPRSDDGTWSEGYVRNVRQHLKNLFVWLGREWAEDYYIGAPAEGKVERSDLLEQDELTALWEAAEHPRDEVLVALPLVTWQRNAVLRAFRLRDVEFSDDGTSGTIRIFEDALGRKRAKGKKPLTWATGPVKRWMEKHPRRGDLDAPLICVITDSGNAEKGSQLGNAETYNKRLRTLAKRAGLDRDRWDTSEGRKERTIRAHILRYTGATRAAISDTFSESTVKAWGGWKQSSEQLDRYIQVVDEDVIASADAAHGRETDLPERPEFSSCPSCSAAIEEWHPACPACLGPLHDVDWTHEANEADQRPGESVDPFQDVEDAIQALASEYDDPSKVSLRLTQAIGNVMAGDRASIHMNFGDDEEPPTTQPADEADG